MNIMTQAVLKYKKSNDEIDFQPVWDHFEPKIRYMAGHKSTQLPIDRDSLYELMIDGLLLAIKNFNPKKSEFSTYLYRWIQGKISNAMKKINRPKHCVNIKTVSLIATNVDGQEMEIPFEDPKAKAMFENEHTILSNRTIDSIQKMII